MIWEAILTAIGIDTVKGSLKAAKGQYTKEQYRQLLSAALAELLQLDPDINKAEANILAAEALGLPPSSDLLTARGVLQKTKKHYKGGRRLKAKKKPQAKKHAKKKTTRPAKRKARSVRKKRR